MVQETLRWPQCRPHFELRRNLTLFAVAGKPVSSPRGRCAMSAQCAHGVPPDRRVTSSGIDLQHVLHRVQSLVGPEANAMCRVAAIVNHAHLGGRVCGVHGEGVNRYTSHTPYLNAYSCSQFVCTALHIAQLIPYAAWLKAQD